MPLMQGRISAGGGLIPDNSIEMHCAFHKEWIARKGDYRKMSLIPVLGDSMAPTLLDGDVVLVNHNVNSITVSGGIYAIVLEDEILIKRIEKLIPSGQLKVKGDNPDYESFIVDPPQIIINGN